MAITEAQYRRIAQYLPVQCRNVRLSNLQVLNTKSAVLDRMFEQLQREHIILIKVEAVSLDSTIAKVHSDGIRALKSSPQSIGISRGAWTTKVHIVAADARHGCDILAVARRGARCPGGA